MDFAGTGLQVIGFYSYEMQWYATDQNIFHLFDSNLRGRVKWPIDYNSEYKKIEVLQHIATVLSAEKEQELTGKCSCSI